MSDKKLRFRIGLFVLASLILLAGLIYMFGNFPSMFRSRDGETYQVVFDNAPGVEVGTPVRRSGIKIGEVSKVELNDETGQVTISVVIMPGRTLRKSDDAILSSNLLSGDTAIDFLTRKPKEGQPLDTGKRDPNVPIVGNPPTNVNQLLARASEVVPPAQKTLEAIQQSIKRVEQLAPVIEQTLKSYDKLARDVGQAVPDVQATAKEIRTFATEVRKTVPDLQSTAKQINQFAQEARGTNQEVKKLTLQMQKIIPSIETTTKQVGELATTAKQVIPDFQEVAKKVGELATEVKLTVPTIQSTAKDLQRLVQESKKAIPLAKNVLKELELAAKNWGSVGEEVGVFLSTNQDRMQKLLENSDKAVKGVAGVFNEDNVKNFERFLNNLGVASKDLPSLMRNANKLFEEGRGVLRQAEPTLTRFNGVLYNLLNITNADSEIGKGLIRSFTSAANKLNTVLGDVSTIIKVAAKKDGTFQRFLTDPALYNHLDDAALMITRVLPRVDRILKDFEVFADKVARHPESIGLGGLVRPSTGIKNSPFRQPRR